MSKIKKIILASMLLTILIILNRFVSIKTEVLVISFSFVPIMMSAIWLGFKYSTAIALLGDLLGAILFPFGPYFPGNDSYSYYNYLWIRKIFKTIYEKIFI